MTTAAARYLEESEVDDLSHQLEQQGYIVGRSQRFGDLVFDLVATKGDRKIAFEVKARNGDPVSVGDIGRKRERAFEEGFDDFRLVVVNPPHETAVDIPGLDDLLSAYLAEHRTGELDDLPGVVRVAGVDNLDIDVVEITTDGIHLVGAGTVTVDIEYDGGEERDGLNLEVDFPLAFDITLSHALRIEDIHSNSIRVDTSGFYE